MPQVQWQRRSTTCATRHFAVEEVRFSSLPPLQVPFLKDLFKHFVSFAFHPIDPYHQGVAYRSAEQWPSSRCRRISHCRAVNLEILENIVYYLLLFSCAII